MKRLLFTIVCCVAVQAVAQVPVKRNDKLKSNVLQPVPRPEDQREGVGEVFQELEKYIAEGAARLLAGYVGSQVFLDLGGGSQGNFSSNQALSLLESFFIQRKPLSFAFTSINQRAPLPFATGKLEYLYKGNKESAHVYIALTKRDSLWQVTQLTIY